MNLEGLHELPLQTCQKVKYFHIVEFTAKFIIIKCFFHIVILIVNFVHIICFVIKFITNFFHYFTIFSVWNSQNCVRPCLHILRHRTSLLFRGTSLKRSNQSKIDQTKCGLKTTFHLIQCLNWTLLYSSNCFFCNFL